MASVGRPWVSVRIRRLGGAELGGRYSPPEEQQSQQGVERNFNAFRSIKDHIHPPRMSAPLCIVTPTEQMVIRPHIVPLLPTFHGIESENPYSYIREFEEACNTFKEETVIMDLMRLKLFPTHRTNSLNRQISNFAANENEKFYAC